MTDKISVKPTREGMKLSHPVGGVLPDEGGKWPADQFTFRRIAEGALERVNEKAGEISTDAVEGDRVSDATIGRRK